MPLRFSLFEGGGPCLFANMMSKKALPRNMQAHFLCKLLLMFVENPCAIPPQSLAPLLFRHSSGRWKVVMNDTWVLRPTDKDRAQLNECFYSGCWKAAMEPRFLTGVSGAIAVGEGGPIGPHRMRIWAPGLPPGCIHLKSVRSKFGKI